MDIVTLILFILGFVLLVGGAELLVRGASTLAIAIGISPLVVGLTVVAYGTSAPELAVTVNAALAGQSDLGLGNVIGSNIANILLVLGMAAATGTLVVQPQLIRQEIPLMIFASLAVLVMGLDGAIGRVDGLILFSGAIIYTVYVVRQSRQNMKAEQNDSAAAFTQKQALKNNPKKVLLQLGMIVAGLALLVTGADWLINGATKIAELLGISKLVIGLTVVAVGTSLPEIATSVIAGVRGQRDIAVGNAVGSNIFNILLVLGFAAVLAPAGVLVSRTALTFDIPIMIAVALTTLPIFFTDSRIDRWEGVLFLMYYAAYTVYLFLNATSHNALDEFQFAMTCFVLPITALSLILLTIKAIRYPKREKIILE
jgi:cation:H+ antiporter